LAKLAIDQAKNTLYGAQGNRDAIKGNDFSWAGPRPGRGPGAQREIGVTIARSSTSAF
jgi:hypothetical protein